MFLKAAILADLEAKDVYLESYKKYKLNEALCKFRLIHLSHSKERLEVPPNPLPLAGVLWILVKIDTRLTNYRVVAEERLPQLDRLIHAVSSEELGEYDRIYYQYFKASITKRLGQYIEAREQFHKILDHLSAGYL